MIAEAGIHRQPLSRRWLLTAALGATLAAGIGLFWRFDPNTTDSPFLSCMFLAFSGWYCAGCGITRALHALAHGDIGTALAFNPLAVLLLPVAGIATAWALGWRAAWMRPMLATFGKPWLWIALVPGFWVARNLPWAPFSWLAPG